MGPSTKRAISTHFGPFRGHFGGVSEAISTHFGPLRGHFGGFRRQFRPILGYCGVVWAISRGRGLSFGGFRRQFRPIVA